MSANTTVATATGIKNFIYASESEFVQDWHVRVTWIAFMTLWVIWGLIWVVRSFFVTSTTTEAEVSASTTDPEVSHKKFHIKAPTFNGSFAPRLERGYQVVKDALFSLLCLLSMNTFARASTYAVMILAWFFVAFAVFWFGVELVVDNRYVRVLYTVIFYALGLAIGGLAYKQGFY
ncbi:hypothetical protein [Parasitella parasitica]|uniref:Uncharacterized protein n=1 Tax=Parasitella parasitica TaxID=35722 RepID=A0A0B7MXN7_9FUNG|nr:hypothetical protein [Parasitella parasitica]